MRKIFLSLLALGMLIALLPKICSTRYAAVQIERRLEKCIGGQCSIESLSLNWLGSQVCNEVKWIDEEKGLHVEADCVSIRASLWDCVRYEENPLDVRIEGVTLNLKAGMKWIKKSQKDLDIVFSPIDAILSNREIAFRHTELEINKKMSAYGWGTLNLNRETLEMTLGLPQPLLAKVFKECRYLPEDFLLEIPLSCDLNVQSIQKKLFLYLLKNYATITSLHK